MMDTFVPKHEKLGEGFSKRDKLAGQEVKPLHGGKRAAGPAAWLSDLIELRKVVILCSFCRAKFNPRQFGYRRVFVPDATGKSDGYTVNGTCDWCKGETANLSGGTAFQPEELYKLSSIDPQEQRRNARLKAKSLGTWQFLQKRKYENV
jgi:hypothetical protein